MTLEYLIAPGHTRSKHDGQVHYVDAPRLARLYGLSVPEARPPAASLIDHEDKRIAKAAQKVMAAAAALDAAWEANAAKAALRAKRDKLKKQLAEVEAQPRGAAPVAAQTVDYKAVRAWAEANGYEVPKVGRIGQNIVDAYNQAGGAA